MTKVEQIDIKAIFEKASGHKIADSNIRTYTIEPKPLAEVPPTE